MAREAETMDISHLPEVLSLAQDVRHTNVARIPRANGEEVARIVPPKARPRGRKGRPTSAADPFWDIVGMAHSGDPSNVSERVDEYLAAAELAHNRR